MPYIVAIVIILVVGAMLYAIVTQALAYREKMEMLKRGFVPTGYQPINPAATHESQPTTQSDQPAALPPAPWGAQQWQEGVQTTRYPGEQAKNERSSR